MKNDNIYGYVYLITNLVNDKQYVGQTVETIEERFSNHCTCKTQVISKAIKKYGKENFTVQELAIAYNKKKSNFLEGLYLSWFNTLAPNGYNIKDIIDGKGKNSKETIEKMKIAQNKPERLTIASNIGKKTRAKRRSGSASKYCGVCIKNNKYLSKINYNNKRINIGYYYLEEDAARAYDIKALELFGKDCNLNFPELRQDYINGKIIVNKSTLQDRSKSRIKNITFNKKNNRWICYYNNRKNTKTFKTIEEAKEFLFKTTIRM